MSILKFKTTKESWENIEREKYLNLFLEEEYGLRPEKCNEKLNYIILDSKIEDEIFIQKVGMYYLEQEMIFYIFLPNKKVSEKLKTFIQVIYPYVEEDIDLYTQYKSLGGYCPIKEIINRNYAIILLSCKTIVDDKKWALTSGIFKTMNSERTSNSWGNISAWAWGCSKVLDYLYNRSEFDTDRVAVIGHSRGGKTALLAGALDKRFYLIISNNSGNSGAALSRNNQGETVENITKHYFYWFCENYKKYANNEEELPFDQHMFIGMQAPRYCYIASATDDEWADPEGELKSAKLASHFYEIYGLKGLIVPDNIELNTSYNEGCIAYHRRIGKHDLTLLDWNFYMNYFDKIA